MSPGSRESKDAVADNAEVYVDGTEHWMLLPALEQHTTVIQLGSSD